MGGGRVFADEYSLPYLRLGFHLLPLAGCVFGYAFRRWSLSRAKPYRRGGFLGENYYVMRHYSRKRKKRPVEGFVDQKGKNIRIRVSGGSTGFYKRPGGFFYAGL